MRRMVVAIFCVASLVSCVAQESVNEKSTEVLKSEAEWKSELTQEQYFILREKGTERPGTGKYNLHFEEGVYHCAECNAPLFKSDSKFESHCGWPSFDQAVSDSTIVESVDTSHGMVRTEITCAKCGGHLGHVFDDGTTNTGLRYCVNSGALEFE